MIDAFRSHCRQNYPENTSCFSAYPRPMTRPSRRCSISSSSSPSRIRLIECPARLGANGKVSNLIQLARHARYPYLLINDSDITVGPTTCNA